MQTWRGKGVAKPGTARPRSTDWDSYYLDPPRLAALSRRYTRWRLLRQVRHVVGPGPVTIAEFGGANSFFLPALANAFAVSSYHIIDTNRRGLEMSERFRPLVPQLHLWEEDVVGFDRPLEADLAFSVGLIEHLEGRGIAKALEAHLACTRDAGSLLLTFPTPTWLYRAARAVAERAGVWRFWDEVPLRSEDVLPMIGNRTELVHAELLWPILFTQAMLVMRKRQSVDVPTTASAPAGQL